MMEKKNPGTISSFLKDTYTDAATAENTETLGKKQWGTKSYLEILRKDIREAHTTLAYCFTDSLFSLLNRPVMS